MCVSSTIGPRKQITVALPFSYSEGDRYSLHMGVKNFCVDNLSIDICIYIIYICVCINAECTHFIENVKVRSAIGFLLVIISFT